MKKDKENKGETVLTDEEYKSIIIPSGGKTMLSMLEQSDRIHSARQFVKDHHNDNDIFIDRPRANWQRDSR